MQYICIYILHIYHIYVCVLYIYVFCIMYYIYMYYVAEKTNNVPCQFLPIRQWPRSNSSTWRQDDT